jgi:hypothetical protein
MKILSAALLFAMSAAAAAQDGGNLSWLGRGVDPVESVYNDARKAQQPMLLFFSAEGDSSCKQVCDGAFRHPDVVAATRKITCVWVECGRDGKRNSRMTSKLGVTAVPTLLLSDPEGHILGELNRWDGAGMAVWLKALTNVNEQLPIFTEDVNAAYTVAKVRGQALLIYFYDDSPGSLAVNRSLNDAELRPLHSSFSVCRTEMKRDSAICKQFDVTRAPTILVLDPRLPRPAEKPLATITSSRTARELRRDLEEALDAARTAGISAKSAGGKDDPPPAPAKIEKLSDDEVDRKFIRARFSRGMELAKKGQKSEALEVLQDIVVTFPKHVETVAVKKYIEELKAEK